MNEFDVAIVGAGPAGSATAITLATRGYRVALLDRAVFPRDKLCGDFINPINWPVLEELKVDRQLLGLPHTKVSRFRLTTADGAEAVSALPVQAERPYGLGLRRYYLDHVLLAQAKRVGVSVNEGIKLKALAEQPRGWRLDMSRGGEPFSLRAKLLVGADGRNSWVARQLGVPSPAAKRSATVGFEIQLQNVPSDAGSVEIHQFTGGYGGIVRVDDSRVNLCFTVRRTLLGKSISFESLRARVLDDNPFLKALLRAGEPVSEFRSVSPVYFPARRCFGDGYLLVGDAARVTEPVTGEGIYLALRSGQLGAATIAAALAEGKLSAARLSGYGRACQAEFTARLRLNSLIRNLAYRPKVLSLAVRFLRRRERLLESLVHAVCARRASLV